MKISTNEHKIESHGLADSGNFSIKASPHAFHILSSGLYSNKIRAVIRELSCNAVDAHVLGNNAKKPIEVKLPNALDKQFYVKDFGTGLTHEQVMKLYTTYFESTKQDSNDFIGGLGVGSKSPFAYTDSFTVESRKDGKKRVYAAYLGPENTPVISQMSEEDTKEPNGLTVGFPVKPDDFRDFTNEALSVYQSFKVTPILKGTSHSITPVKIDLKKLTPTVYASSENNGFPWNNSVRMGNVVYPLDLDKIADGDNFLTWITQQQGIFIDVPIGTYSVAASREQLQYDPATIAAFKKDMGAFKDAWLKKAKEFIAQREAEPEKFKQRQMTYKWLSENKLVSNAYNPYRHSANYVSPESILKSLKHIHNIDIQPQSPFDNVRANTTAIKITSPSISTRSGTSRVMWPNGETDPIKQRETSVYIDYTKDLEIIIADSKQYKDIVSSYILSNTNKDKAYLIISSRKGAAQSDITSEINALKTKAGFDKVKMVSELPKNIITSAKTGPATTKEEIRASSISPDGYYQRELNVSNMTTLDSTQRFVWLPYTPSSKEFDSKDLTDDRELQKLIHMLYTLQQVENALEIKNEPIYAVNTIYRKRMPAFTNALTFEKYVEELLNNPKIKPLIDKTRELINVEFPNNKKGIYGRSSSEHTYEVLKTLAKAINDKPLGEKIDKTLPTQVLESKLTNLCLAMNGLLGKTVGNLNNLKIIELENVSNFIQKKYPLIHTDVYANAFNDKRNHKVSELNKYIEWKDSQEPIKISFQ